MRCENTYGSDSDGLDSKRHRLIEKYAVANKLHRMYLERELNRSGVFRSQHQMLMYISRFPNASQKDIAEHQHVSTATIAVSLKKLEKGGYINRAMDETDNRFNQICITPKGKAIVDCSVKVFQKVEQSLFASFSEEELSLFEDFLDRVRLNLEHLFQESDTTKGGAEQHSDKITDRIMDRIKERAAGGMTEKVTEEVTEKVTEEVTDEVTEEVTEEVTDGKTDTMTDRVTDEVTSRHTGRSGVDE